MSFKYFLFSACFTVLLQASEETTILDNKVYASGEINDYVDRMLSLVRPAMVKNGFDPFKIEKLIQDFWFKPLFINYTGRIELENGWLQDLSTIYRLGDAKVKYEKQMLTLSVDFIVDSLIANFDYKAKIFDIGPSGYLTAIIRKQDIRFSILVDFERITFHLQQFALTNNEQVKIKLTGLGLADFIVNIIIDALAALFRNSVTQIIGMQIRSAIQTILENIPPFLPPPPAAEDKLHMLLSSFYENFQRNYHNNNC